MRRQSGVTPEGLKTPQQKAVPVLQKVFPALVTKGPRGFFLGPARGKFLAARLFSVMGGERGSSPWPRSLHPLTELFGADA